MIRASNLVKVYKGPGRKGDGTRAVALNGVDFHVPEGQFVSLLGPSGCGKTTSLRSIAGLIRPDSGSIHIDGETVFSSDPAKFVPPERRGIGMVFQSYAIWPHMSVYENVAYPLKAKRKSRKGLRDRVMASLDTVGLAELADRPAPALSGGQQQRVALARALVAEPRVLLLDEPLSNLDARLRDQMRDELRRLQRHLGLTALYVTHDQQEALAMSDQVVVMHGGRVLDVGSPREVYAAPKYRFTANFLGVANFLSGVVRERNGGDVTVETPAGRLTLLDRDASVGERVTLFFRPEDVRVVDASSPATGNRIAAHVEDAVYLGGVMDTRMVTISGSLTLRARFHPCEAPTTGSNVVLELRHGALSRIQENDDSQSALPTTDDHDMAPNDPGSPSSSALSA